MRRGVLSFLLCALTLLVACRDSRSTSPLPEPITRPTDVAAAAPAASAPRDATLLAGRSFVGVSAIQGGVPRPLGTGRTVRLAFRGDSVRYTAGCNSMSAWVELADGHISLRDGASTAALCTGTLGANEVWLRSFMDSRPAWEVQGMVLTLTTGDAVLTLLDRRAAEPNRPLEQPTHWLLRSIASGDDTAVVPNDKLPFIEFVGGRFFGGTTCNDISGNVVAGAVVLELSGLQVGPIPCTEPMATVERRLLALLDGPVEYTITGQSLVITKLGGSRADFLAQDDGY